MGFPNTWNKRAVKFIVKRLILPATLLPPQLELAKEFYPFKALIRKKSQELRKLSLMRPTEKRRDGVSRPSVRGEPSEHNETAGSGVGVMDRSRRCAARGLGVSPTPHRDPGEEPASSCQQGPPSVTNKYHSS